MEELVLVHRHGGWDWHNKVREVFRKGEWYDVGSPEWVEMERQAFREQLNRLPL